MKRFSFFPYYNRSQRRGIMLLFGIIFLLQGVLIFQDEIFPSQPIPEFSVPQALQQQYDSLKTLALQKKKKKIYPFNPNYLSDYRGYYLGMSVEEIDRVWAYRKQGKYFQNKQEFKQISGISDSLFEVLKPYINIPVYPKFSKSSKPVLVSTTDINRATASDLRVINGIGEVLSKRIIKYRNAIGGFTDKNQLNKVYGLEPEVIQRVWQKFKISGTAVKTDKSLIDKLPINTATAEDLKKVNGIGDKLSKRIIRYRNQLGGFAVKEELNEVYGLTPDVIDRVWQYFELKHPHNNIKKIDLNDANIIELAKNPHISYQLAKKIVSYRTINGAFSNFDELLKVEEYPAEKHRQIIIYLTLKN